MGSILLIDTDKQFLAEVLSLLRNSGYHELISCSNMQKGLRSLENENCDLVIYNSLISCGKDFLLPETVIQDAKKFGSPKFIAILNPETLLPDKSSLIADYNVHFVLRKPLRPKDILLPVQENYNKSLNDNINQFDSINHLPAEHLIIFTEATCSTFEMMTDVKLEPGNFFYRKTPFSYADISANMKITGSLEGTICLSFEKTTALAIAGKILMEEVSVINQSVKDSLGELVNIISGNSKSKLLDYGFDFSIGLPKVSSCKQFIHQFAGNISVSIIPFETPYGKFYIETCLKPN